MNQDQDTHDLLTIWPALGQPCTQQELADLVGVTQGAISRHIAAGHIPRDGTALEQIRAYVAHLAAEAKRQTGDGILSLPAERAALARVQREAWEIRNKQAQSEYAPAPLLRAVLATASAAMVANIDQLDEQIRQAVPDLPEPAWAAIQHICGKARRNWIGFTSRLVYQQPDTDDSPDEPTGEDGGDDES